MEVKNKKNSSITALVEGYFFSFFPSGNWNINFKNYVVINLNINLVILLMTLSISNSLKILQVNSQILSSNWICEKFKFNLKLFIVFVSLQFTPYSPWSLCPRDGHYVSEMDMNWFEGLLQTKCPCSISLGPSLLKRFS